MSDPVQPGLTLKLIEPVVNADIPWVDDALQREQYATALTNLIDGEASPLVVSMNGTWGSGKTFFLKRWQAQLTKNGFKSIYFNAWEDDHCGDPLVAIIGQLWNSLKDSDLKEIGKSIKKSAKPLLTKTVFNTVKVITGEIVDLNEKDLKNVAEQTVDDYFTTREQRDELKGRLNEMASKVAEKTKHPMIFIIDELDRCRPTFAIELLERVKHIFDIPNLVFVFGIDRRQLGGAIQSVYGNIDIDGYLRRFFDMELILPVCDSKLFCQHMLKSHNLAKYFQAKNEIAKSKIHTGEYTDFQNTFSLLAHRLRLSLRDIQHAIRSFVFVSKNLQDRQHMYPELLAVLIILRIKNHELYTEYIKGQCLSAKVLDYIESFSPHDVSPFDRTNDTLDYIEVALYLSAYVGHAQKNIIREQLELLLKSTPLISPDHLSQRTRNKSMEDLSTFVAHYDHRLRNSTFESSIPTKQTIGYLVERIEMASMMIKDQ
ncbi:MAG: P-loop NTPase fold protein [Victivallales bacterium]